MWVCISNRAKEAVLKIWNKKNKQINLPSISTNLDFSGQNKCENQYIFLVLDFDGNENIYRSDTSSKAVIYIWLSSW